MAQQLSERTRTLVRSAIPNYESLNDEQQLIGAIRVISSRFDIYCERNLSIQDKMTAQMTPFTPNWEQQMLIDHVIRDLATGTPVRYIILKARQMGISTVIEALCYWWTATHRYVNSVIIAHEAGAAENLYEMFRRYHEFSNEYFQPVLKYNTRKNLVFDVEDKVKDALKQHISICRDPHACGVSHKSLGLGSSIKTMVAKDGKGRSLMITFFHGSEVAFWETKADVVSSAIQAVPMGPNTFVFLESTANGVGGYYYDEWQNAVSGEGSLRPLFFAWHEHTDYELPIQVPIASYDDEEGKLIEVFKEKLYPTDSWDRKITWRRAKKKEFRYNPKKFYQEYPADDMEAFLASGNPVFEIESLRAMDNYARKHISHRFGAIIPVESRFGRSTYVFEEIMPSFDGQEPAPLKVWDEVEEDEQYVIGVDVSEGIMTQTNSGKESDWAVVDVMNRRTLKTVARWRGHIDPDLLGGVVYAIGIYYNKALVAVEVNNHGLTTVQSLKNKSYPHMYTRKQAEDQKFQERTSLMGWQTNRKTKKVIIDNLVHAIRDGDILDLDILFIRECMTYVKDDQGFTNAQEGRFDDTVMAKAIALKVSDFAGMNSDELKEKINKPIKRNKHASNTSSSLESIARPGTSRSTTSDAVRRRRSARQAHRISRRSR